MKFEHYLLDTTYKTSTYTYSTILCKDILQRNGMERTHTIHRTCKSCARDRKLLMIGVKKEWHTYCEDVDFVTASRSQHAPCLSQIKSNSSLAPLPHDLCHTQWLWHHLQQSKHQIRHMSDGPERLSYGIKLRKSDEILSGSEILVKFRTSSRTEIEKEISRRYRDSFVLESEEFGKKGQ
jgi:hypothetical protein